MIGTETASASTMSVVRLSDLQDGQEAESFAALVNKVLGKTYKNEPYVKCVFRDKRMSVDAMFWANHRLHHQAKTWADGIAYRLRVRARVDAKYGLQIEVYDIRPAVPEDAADGYDFQDLVESSRFALDKLLSIVHECIQKYVTEPYLNRLVLDVLRENEELFKKMQAASKFHHAYTGGLLEHVWSMTRISGFLADHYAKYYDELNPPLNKGVIVAAAILHDIGKLRELRYHPVEAKYTKLGKLVGHVLMGRDLVREVAGRIEGFPEETLLLLEHAILAHHGKREFGAPILPMTLEAILVSYVDELDAKMNAAARERLRESGDGEFTDRIYSLEREIYKGIPVEPPADDPPPGQF